MGIQGLLPVLKNIQQDVHLSQLSGKRIAVDGYCWLHRSVFGCAQELFNNPQGTDRYVHFCMNLVGLLRHHGVIPYIVFDGARLPSKAGKEKERQAERAKNRAKAEEYQREGKRDAANEYYAKAVDVTPYMAYRWIRALREQNVEYLVAPYEADAQLAYLCRNGMVDAVLTEDSDLLAYACPWVLFKLDKQGNAKEVKIRNLPSAVELNFHSWTQDMFLQMCVLAGCDFLPSLQGMGVKTAHKFIKGAPSSDVVFRRIQLSGKFNVPQDYRAKFEDACATFTFHWVFDPERQELVHCMRELPEGSGPRPDILGPEIPPETARRVARGEIDPMTHEPFPSSPPREQPPQRAGPPRPQMSGGPQPAGRPRPAPFSADNGFGPISKKAAGAAQPAGAAEWKSKRDPGPLQKGQKPISSFFAPAQLPGASAAASRGFKPPRPVAPKGPTASFPPRPGPAVPSRPLERQQFEPIVLDADEGQGEGGGGEDDEEVPPPAPLGKSGGAGAGRDEAKAARPPDRPREQTSRYFAAPERERSPSAGERTPARPASPGADPWSFTWGRDEEDEAAEAGSGSGSAASSRPGSACSAAAGAAGAPKRPRSAASDGSGGEEGGGREAGAAAPPAPLPSDAVARCQWDNFVYKKARPHSAPAAEKARPPSLRMHPLPVQTAAQVFLTRTKFS
eukprot:tig00000403_g297.t1